MLAFQLAFICCWILNSVWTVEQKWLFNCRNKGSFIAKNEQIDYTKNEQIDYTNTFQYINESTEKSQGELYIDKFKPSSKIHCKFRYFSKWVYIFVLDPKQSFAQRLVEVWTGSLGLPLHNFK